MIKNMNKLCPLLQRKMINDTFFECIYTLVLRMFIAKMFIAKALNKVGQSKL